MYEQNNTMKDNMIKFSVPQTKIFYDAINRYLEQNSISKKLITMSNILIQ